MAGSHFGLFEDRHEDDEGREYCCLAMVVPLKRDDELKHDNCLRDGDGDKVARVEAGDIPSDPLCGHLRPCCTECVGEGYQPRR